MFSVLWVFYKMLLVCAFKTKSASSKIAFANFVSSINLCVGIEFKMVIDLKKILLMVMKLLSLCY